MKHLPAIKAVGPKRQLQEDRSHAHSPYGFTRNISYSHPIQQKNYQRSQKGQFTQEIHHYNGHVLSLNNPLL